MKRFLKYDTEDAKNGIGPVDKNGVMRQNIFTVTFTPVTINDQNYMVADKTQYEIYEAYFSGKQIKASIAFNDKNINELLLQFNQDEGISFYYFQILSSGTNGIKSIGIAVIGDPTIAPVDSNYDETWKEAYFELQASTT